ARAAPLGRRALERLTAPASVTRLARGTVAAAPLGAGGGGLARRRQSDRDVGRDVELGFERGGALQRARESRHPALSLLGCPRLVFEIGECPGPAAVGRDGQRGADEPASAHAGPTARDLDAVVALELKAFELESDLAAAGLGWLERRH